MKKTTILAMAAVTMLTTSVGFAAPLDDYSAGKTQVDLTWRQSDVKAEGDSTAGDFNKKGNMEFGITTGLGNNFALQYNNFNGKSKDTDFTNGGGEFSAAATLKMQEFNVLYKVDKNLSVYTGITSVKGSFDSTIGNSESDTKNKLQFGVIGSTKLGDKTTAYAKVGVASGMTNWKVGVSQEVAPNLELNVDYGSLKVNKMAFNNGMGDVDMTSKGLGFGISYKF
ncbi:hypothetical protein SAMN05660742_11497 [Propionispira arboris]|uniref:Outer membrane protein beta-barrel domain-containing protein n=1 Tax=Propionispira arboris TaxID=84035 RepID=A0A1H7B4U4_9FIRM|nr:hypothetical protein [Propionispira arboris]SEJ71267.1 hypothetical protein SAMN05660742_11497 [Propionispira arboris]